MRRNIVFHFVAWTVLYLFWIFVFQNRALTFTRTLTVEFCYLIFIAAAFYFITQWLVPKFLYQKKIVFFGALALLAIAVAAFLRALTAVFISHRFFPGAPVAFPQLLVNSLLTVFFWTNLLVIACILADRVRSQRELAAIERDRIEQELKFLKAQNNPHFLFNSLNLIYFQIDKNNAAARETLMKFSEMLRYQLYDCGNDRIPVEKELHYLRNYISLQQLRMNENYRVTVTGNENIQGFSIAPLLILPLVENAFKHVSFQPDGIHEISISFDYYDGKFFFNISNPKNPASANEGSSHKGIGMENVQRRLELLYPGKHSLGITTEKDNFSVSLILQTDETSLPGRG